MDYITAIAETGGTYETEYDGQMLVICFFCHANIWDNESHDSECVYLSVINTDQWKARVAREELDKDREYKNSDEYLSQRVECELCGKMKSRAGMNSHQESLNCTSSERRD